MAKKPNQTTNEQLDRIGQMLVRAAAKQNNDAIESVAASPFLYTRITARISERTKAYETEEGWLALLSVARRVVPALTAVTAIVFTLMLWLASGGATPTANGFGDEAFFDPRETAAEQAVLTDSNTLSRDDVLTIVVNREEQTQR